MAVELRNEGILCSTMFCFPVHLTLESGGTTSETADYSTFDEEQISSIISDAEALLQTAAIL